MTIPPGFNIRAAQVAPASVSHRPYGPSTGGVGNETMPPGFKAEVAQLDTFKLPEHATGSLSNRRLGRALVDAWRRDGIIQIAMSDAQRELWEDAKAASHRFFREPHGEKAACVDSQSYAGYIASGEEVTDGIADYSEIFTITKDLGPSDPRVRARWPCHGSCPWPNINMKEPMARYNEDLGIQGEKLLQLAELGLGVSPGSLTRYTRDGWHHTRVLRFPPRNATNGKGKEGRGIGSHTDYGLLVISTQDEVGGLFIRRPSHKERFANWEKSAAGLREDDDGWVYIPPVEGVHTVILGDMMQYITHNYLTATPHKVGLNTRERFAFAYFHEPSFQAVVRPLEGGCGGMLHDSFEDYEGIHYGTHFTNMFMRNYPDRITTKRLIAEDRYKLLAEKELRTMDSVPAS
ncbi:2-oxoglutarate-dependent ethylene/succinate-forming enzyme [Lasiosphaeris hirsuta]|uniref:2-oxoglutarate-dependent ethylene/succinate-forming enzyme n=1 Tax=Lasiosphaeris hirsuta TaxID=260670 RepID=A0AA40DUB8_9PEZI|nr:2-oxoglutarate-dependent ethylene/succinate-forming enzyme [Lasiosphaeris hirsuta]